MEEHKGHTMTYEGGGRFYCIKCDKMIGRGVDKPKQKPRWVLNENILYVMGRQDLAGGELIILYDDVGIKYAIIDTGIGYINYTESVGYTITRDKPYKGLKEIRVRTNNLDLRMEELQVRGENAVIGGQVGQLRAKYNNNSVYFMKGYQQELRMKNTDGITRTVQKIGERVLNVGPVSKEDNRNFNIEKEKLRGIVENIWIVGKGD